MATLDKRLEKLETRKERQPYYPLHIYLAGSKREPGPERPCYPGPNGEMPFVIVHEAEVPE